MASSALRPLSQNVRIPIENFADFEREVGRQIRQAVFQKAMPQAGKAVRLLLERETISRGVFFKKKFARSWRMEIGNASSSIRIVNRQPYASVIEFGRRRGARMPPPDALIPWVIGKLGVSRKDARRVAFMVARKIHEFGIPARPIIRDPIVREKTQQLVINIVLEKLAAAAERAANKKRR